MNCPICKSKAMFTKKARLICSNKNCETNTNVRDNTNIEHTLKKDDNRYKKGICEVCGKEIIKYQHQKYCFECSEKKTLERKLKWAKKHYPAQKDKISKNNKDRRTVNMPILKKIGEKTSKKNCNNHIHFDNNKQLNPLTLLIIKTPFTFNLSKNCQSRFGAYGHVYLRKEANMEREKIINKIIASEVKFVTGKIWISLLIQKPEARGDAINFVDAICDAIKKGIGVDDNWFCIKQVDWEIKKEDPHIYIRIEQENNTPHRACSYCGRILTEDNFSGIKKKTRECKSCLIKMRRYKKKEKEKKDKKNHSRSFLDV